MTKTKHKITAISLAFLVLISTTGIGLNTMLCSCTGQQYLAFLVTKLNLNCCKGTLGDAVKENSCSSSSIIKKQQSNFELPSVIEKEDCCSSSFKYAKASINLELSEEIPLPTSSLVAYHWFYTLLPYEQPVLIPQTVAYSNLSNKAPPRFKESILNWFQIYRC